MTGYMKRTLRVRILDEEVIVDRWRWKLIFNQLGHNHYLARNFAIEETQEIQSVAVLLISIFVYAIYSAI